MEIRVNRIPSTRNRKGFVIGKAGAGRSYNGQAFINAYIEGTKTAILNEFDINIDEFSIEDQMKFINAYQDMQNTRVKFLDLVSETRATLNPKGTECEHCTCDCSDRNIETAKRVVREILVPSIDPEYERRSKDLQNRIFDHVFDFYIISTTFPVDTEEFLTELVRKINEEINKD